jgi:hypothetical protein
MPVNSIIHDKNTVYDQSRIDFFMKKLQDAAKEKDLALVNMYATEIDITKRVIEIQTKQPKNYLSVKERNDASLWLTMELEDKRQTFCNLRDDGVYNKGESDRFKVASQEFLSAIKGKEEHEAYCLFRDVADLAMVSKKRILEICNAAPSDKRTDYWKDHSDKMRNLYLSE